MTVLLRAAALTNFEAVAGACGLDARALVAEVGLPSRCLTEPDLMVPAGLVNELLERAAARAGEPAFGLRMAATRRLSNLGPLGLLLRDQPTLRLALEALARHIHVHNESFSVTVVETGPLVGIREEILMERGRPVRQALELGMGTLFRVLRIFLGDNWRPHVVMFRHAAPRSMDWHRQVFGAAVHFSQEHNEIVCRGSDLEAPNPGADPVMAQYAQRLLQSEHGAQTPMTERVRRLIVLLLPLRHCRVEVVAQHLGVSRRTVANHLAEEGTTFSRLVDEMRQDLLFRYRVDGARPLSEIGALLGFSEPSAFSRWHRGRFGASARQAGLGSVASSPS